MTKPKKKTTPTRKTKTNPSEHLRQRVLDDAKTLKVPLSAEILDAALARADQEGLSHLNFLELIFGKSHLLQALGRRYCELGYRVRYTTSADLLEDLRASLADQTLPRRIRYWSRFDLVIIDEFGFDRIERGECPQAANLFYKLIDARSGQRSTALATNIDFQAWSEYLGDPPLAMAFLDRIVDGAILLKIRGKSYRAHRAKKPSAAKADAA